MTNLTGNPDWPMWLGEVGWSSRYTESLLSDMKKCKDFSSAEVFQTFYQGFLGWNLSISNLTEPLTPPEQVFWFTMRDSSVFGIPEYFGLVSKCGDSRCKMTRDKPYVVSRPQSSSTGQGKGVHSCVARPPLCRQRPSPGESEPGAEGDCQCGDVLLRQRALPGGCGERFAEGAGA
ncbi:unnamed protein product [Polarella glacialis]|uniref:Uncharacterized protein n=1 Tax=Polarella glacialis TaxID=89957 RepID=A0A813FHZ7_POLGL|nr:unnamed protein product [Polarella glacialis]